MRLENKVCVITGAGSGMGRAMANLFAKEGAKVVAAEWNQTTLDEVVAEVKAATGRDLEIGGKFGGRDHTTVLHACQKIEKLMQTDRDLRTVVEDLMATLSR